MCMYAYCYFLCICKADSVKVFSSSAKSYGRVDRDSIIMLGGKVSPKNSSAFCGLSICGLQVINQINVRNEI